MLWSESSELRTQHELQEQSNPFEPTSDKASNQLGSCQSARDAGLKVSVVEHVDVLHCISGSSLDVIRGRWLLFLEF